MGNKDYLYFSRKGQITISFLLIFFILFSVFAVGIFASREMWASAKFKGAVDAAALSAGADMARGADLFITITGVRLALFGISILLYIISMPCPGILPVAQSVNDLSKKISKMLGTFCCYIPAAYTLKAEVDAYKIFGKNFSPSEQGTSEWSFYDYGIIVIPNYSINGIANLLAKLNSRKSDNKVSEDSLQGTFLPTTLGDSVDMLKQGVSVFGYRKLSYLEQIKKNLGIKENYSEVKGIDSLEEWLNEHEYIISSAKINKREKIGVDLSDALKISNFLGKWDEELTYATKKNDNDKKKGKTLKDILSEVLEKASLICDSTKDIKKDTQYSNGSNCNASYPNESVCAANSILHQIKNKEHNGFSCNDCSSKVHTWINFCRQISASAGLSGTSDGYSFYDDISSIDKESGTLQSTIDEYKKLLQSWGEENGKNLKLSNLKDAIKNIKNSTEDANKILSNELNRLPENCTCKKTILVGPDENGNYTPETIEQTIDFSPTRAPMNHVRNRLMEILNACDDAVEEMDDANKEFSDLVQSNFKKSQENLSKSFSSFFGSIQDAATAFEGFPGGNLIACIADPENYKCTDCDKCMNIPFVGNIICAAKKDINLLSGLFSGDKVEFASYYSAELEKPPFINPTAKMINNENKDIGKLLNNISDKTLDNISDAVCSAVSDSLTFSDTSGSLSISDIGLSIGGSILSGLLTGGVSIIISMILTTLAETVVMPLITNKIKGVLVPLLKNQVKEWAKEISTTGLGKKMSKALGWFIDIYNVINTTGLRLLGDNSQIGSGYKLSLRFLFSRVAPDIKIRKLYYEENYSPL